VASAGSRDVSRDRSEYQREYYEANKERLADQRREYWDRTREARNEYRRAWAAANREKLRAANRAYYLENRERLLKKQRASGLLRTHGITVEQYDAMLEAQGGICAICETDEPGGKGSFHVDHDHSCCPGKGSCGGCIRGLLCATCNIGLGGLKDDPGVVAAALDYLLNAD
jgi:hypothetical protein